MDPSPSPWLTSFDPVARPDARVLILGSMPGEASLRAGQYYGHPRNAFWSILAGLTGVPADAPYADRLRGLQDSGFALWDVVGRCRRRGSLDADIEPDSIEPNDLLALRARCPHLVRVLCNGATAHRLYLRRLQPLLPDLPVLALPSTSPAHAGLSLLEKTRRWHAALAAP
jgi:double-stranded uracil-DNA glycosylase